MNASGRPNTCKSRGSIYFGMMATGARVRNAYATYPLQGDSPGKPGLIPHSPRDSHDDFGKDLLVMDGHA
jgi:hypothetical protein